MAGVEDLTGADLQAHRLGRLLLGNPEVRREAQRLAKKANPALDIPEIEMDDRLAAVEAAAKVREKELSEQITRERVERRHAEMRSKLVADGYDPDAIDKIVVDFGCNYDKARQIADLQARSAEPTSADVRSGHAVGEHVEMRPETDWRKLTGGELRKKSAQIAGDIISEFRNGKRSSVVR